MNTSENYWLLSEKSDETRISQGIDGYPDRTGDTYHYDSLVPNYKNLKSGDAVILRKENEILGIGRIGVISEEDSVKKHRRCPKCSSTDIRERITKLPRWKCGKCSSEFSEPNETTAKVRSYTAAIQGFSRLNDPPSVQSVKLCASSGEGVKSQLSILQLDAGKIRTVLEGVEISPSPREVTRAASGQGFGLSQEERKIVELFAMRLARKLYEDNGWTVVDKSLSHPFDLLASKDGQRRFIEVKGTTGEGRTIILTRGEIAHAKLHYKESALVVVANICLHRTNDNLTASDGTIIAHHDPWIIIESNLQPTQFRYEVY